MVLIVRTLISCLCLSAALFGGVHVENAPGNSAASAVVMAANGEIVYEKNASFQRPIASTTKIMTAIVVIENCGLDEVVEITSDSCNIEGSSMYLKAGESYTVRELLEGLMLVSGNDAAHALALHTAGSIDAFAELMNEKCRELGMVNSHFKNPHGLSEDGHYSTAADMAKLMVYCMENPDFAKLSATKSSSNANHSFVNHNKLLHICPGCTGGKTGYTMAAGRCLVSSCERDNSRFVCVTLNAPDDWDDHMNLYNWAFSNYRMCDVAQGLRFEIPVVSGEKDKVTLAADKLEVLIPKSEEIEIKAQMPHFIFAPVAEEEAGGSFKAYCKGELIAEGKLIFAESINAS